MPQYNPPGRGSHFVAALVSFLVATVVGMFALAFGSSNIDSWKRMNVDAWPEARARIVDIDIIESTLSSRRTSFESTSYYAKLHYEFDVDGESYNGSWSMPSSDSQWEAEQNLRDRVSSLPDGITVSYLPSDPSISGVEIESTTLLGTLFELGIASFAGLIAVVSAVSGIGSLYQTFFPS